VGGRDHAGLAGDAGGGLIAVLSVGLTGGIGSGKSAAARVFAELGAIVIDADEVAHELTGAGAPLVEDVAREFGADLVDEDGRLDRRRLRALVFDDPARRRRLEALLHPAIRAEMDRRRALARGPYCVLCIPLLVEAGQADMVDRVLVVDAPEGLRVERVMRRDGASRETVEGILRAQIGREQRLAAADDVIANDGDLERLRAQVVELDRRYRSTDTQANLPAGVE